MTILLRPLFLSLLLLHFFFFFISNAAEPVQNYTNCPSYHCGDLLISYPFWRIDDTTQFCGYSGFGINCSGEDAIIRRPDDSYYVEDINYEHCNLTLVDIDVTTAGNCPRVRNNIDLVGLLVISSALNVNLSFHFNCTEIPDFATVIPCLGSGDKLSCVHIVGTGPAGFDWGPYGCGEEVVATVMERAVNRRDRLVEEFSTALNGGFELNWQKMEKCGSCEDSGGRCGYNHQTGEDMCFCSDGRATTDDCKKGSGVNWRLRLVIGLTAAGFSAFIVSFMFFYKSRSCIHHGVIRFRSKNDRNIEAFITEYGSLTPRRYRYSEIKKITKSFRDKLGQGGFGSVFKGKLSDGRLVAIKVLNSSKGNGEDFVNEVASIGRTSHVNIVTLLGFCHEGKKSALVYEFMPNGSLERFIHPNLPPNIDQQLGVKRLHEIALGIARGLEYLHCGCNTRILHLDIKPHNILLDKDFCPKIADFGLAKLYSREESMVSMLEAKGTIGYIAPEVFMRNIGRVSHKSDVYSYGMMMLEMVGGRNNVNANVDHSSDIYFPHWIYKCLEEDGVKLEDLENGEENKFARKMMLVGLWCIQTNPSQRPSMSKVIELLEGSIEAIKVPPKPFFSSHTSPEITFATSDCGST